MGRSNLPGLGMALAELGELRTVCHYLFGMVIQPPTQLAIRRNPHCRWRRPRWPEARCVSCSVSRLQAGGQPTFARRRLPATCRNPLADDVRHPFAAIGAVTSGRPGQKAATLTIRCPNRRLNSPTPFSLHVEPIANLR
jgi:hypothetical protein